MSDVEKILQQLAECGLIERVPEPLPPEEIARRRAQRDVITQAFEALEGSPELVAARMNVRWRKAVEVPGCGRWEPTEKGKVLGIDVLLLHPLQEGKNTVVLPQALLDLLNIRTWQREGILKLAMPGREPVLIPVAEVQVGLDQQRDSISHEL